MVQTLLKWLLVAATLVLLARWLPGIEVASFMTAILAGLVIGLVNALIGPVLRLITLPLTVITLGLFLIVINAFLFWLAAVLVPGFAVTNVLAALLGSLILTLVNRVVDVLVPA